MDVGTMGSFIHHEWRRDGTMVCSLSGMNISSKWVSLYYNIEVLHSNFEGKLNKMTIRGIVTFWPIVERSLNIYIEREKKKILLKTRWSIRKNIRYLISNVIRSFI